MTDRRHLEPARYAIVGSRDYANLDRVRRFVAKLPEGSTVVSGAARGVDETAEGSARARGLEVLSFPADWAQGRGAGHARNADIVAAADIVVAFWDGTSRGTKNSIDRAMAARKPVWLCNPEGRWAFNDPEPVKERPTPGDGEWAKAPGWGTVGQREAPTLGEGGRR